MVKVHLPHCYCYHYCYIVGGERNEHPCGYNRSEGVGVRWDACLLVEGSCGAVRGWDSGEGVGLWL